MPYPTRGGGGGDKETELHCLFREEHYTTDIRVVRMAGLTMRY